MPSTTIVLAVIDSFAARSNRFACLAAAVYGMRAVAHAAVGKEKHSFAGMRGAEGE